MAKIKKHHTLWHMNFLAVIFCPLKEGKDNNVLVPLWGNGRVTATKGLVKIRNISKK